MSAAIFIHRGNFQTGTIPDVIGPFDWVQLTYNHVIRVPEDHEIAHFSDGFWLFEDGSEWTDITVSTDLGEPDCTCSERLAGESEVDELKKRLDHLEVFVKNHMHYVGSGGRHDRHNHHFTNRPNGAEQL